MFVDSVKLSLKAGKGGNGVVAWRREKFIPKGGPCGGNGGKGGSIRLKADPHTFSLEGFRNKRLIQADSGGAGAGNLCQGKNGKDLLLPVPCGTLVKDAGTGEVLFDFTEAAQEWLICAGGRGGKGNNCFKSPTNQAPQEWTPGQEGEERAIELELKLIADIGLVGFPNAGKSTLLTEITHVPVKIGAYPFTTLYPNLGYVRFDDFSRVLVADIPGLIEDAHLNKGLGVAFLKHIERSSVLVFVIDISGFEGREPIEDFKTLRRELAAYRPDMLEKPFLIALNKMDTEEAPEHLEAFLEYFPALQKQIFPLSAKEGQGLPSFLDALRTLAQVGGKKF